MPFSPAPNTQGAAALGTGPWPHLRTPSPPRKLRAAGGSPISLLPQGPPSPHCHWRTRKCYPCKFPGRLGHRAFGSRAQRSHRGLPARVENYHVPWQGLLGHCQRATGSGWHQPLPPGSQGSHGKVERRALGGKVCKTREAVSRGGCPVLDLGENASVSSSGKCRAQWHLPSKLGGLQALARIKLSAQCLAHSKSY